MASAREVSPRCVIPYFVGSTLPDLAVEGLYRAVPISPIDATPWPSRQHELTRLCPSREIVTRRISLRFCSLTC